MSAFSTTFRSTSLALVLSVTMLTSAATRAAELTLGPSQIPLLPLHSVIHAVQSQLSQLDPPLVCPAARPEPFSVDRLMWDQIFWRRLIAEENPVRANLHERRVYTAGSPP